MSFDFPGFHCEFYPFPGLSHRLFNISIGYKPELSYLFCISPFSAIYKGGRKMKQSQLNSIILGSVLAFGLVSNAFAAPHGEDHHGKGMKAGMHGSPAGHGPKHGKKKGMGGTFSPHWVKTLTDEQKISFDKMHLKVAQFEAVQRAKMKMLKAELDVMAATKPNDKNAVYKKIDEIMAVKKSIMRNRYDHISEMRAELTDQQRISYDMGLLKAGKHKH